MLMLHTYARDERPDGCPDSRFMAQDMGAPSQRPGASSDGGAARRGDLEACLEHMIEAEIIPRLLLVHSELPTLAPGAAAPSSAEIRAFSELVLMERLAPARDFVRMLRVRGLAVDVILLDLLAPAARRLGELWEEDERDFTEVTIGLCRLHQLLRELSDSVALPAPAGEGRALLAVAPGEQHMFGLVMAADFLRRAGWEVTEELDAGFAELTARALGGYDVVGFSASTRALALSLRPLIARIRVQGGDRAPPMLVSGRAFVQEPALAAEVGADDVVASCDGAADAAARLRAGRGPG